MKQTQKNEKEGRLRLPILNVPAQMVHLSY